MIYLFLLITQSVFSQNIELPCDLQCRNILPPELPNHIGNTMSASELTKHSVWFGLGIGGSIIGGFPIGVGYSYDFSERVALIGAYSRTSFAQKASYKGTPLEISYSYSTLGFGLRIYTKNSKLVNEKIIPFADITLSSFSGEEISTVLIPSLSFGCKFKFESNHGILAKMNLSPISLLDIAYSYSF